MFRNLRDGAGPIIAPRWRKAAAIGAGQQTNGVVNTMQERLKKGLTDFAISRGWIENGARAFHRAYYDSNVWRGPTQWLGVPAQKFPTDMWIYQEILFECRPDIVIETGTYWGGSALFLATICEAIGGGQIVSIDVTHENLYPITSPRISFIEAPSVEPSTLELVRQIIKSTDTVMVILDSDHQKSHVLAELDAYAPFVTAGQYLIVEDTNINGNPVLPDFGPGPREALEEWLPGHSEFEVDRAREKFGLTTNEGGYLRRS